MAAHEGADAPLILVTGGAGFIGSHTVDELVRRGCRVVVLDNFSTGRFDNLALWSGDDRVRIVEADISEDLAAPLAAVTAATGPIQRIIHMAAQTSMARSFLDPIDDIRVNCAGTVRMLEYARTTGVQKVVLASSSAIYGGDDALPSKESGLERPMSPYGIDKKASELFLEFYGAVHGVGGTAFRFFNVFGPRQDPENRYSGVISIFAHQALAGEPLTIFGDGKQTRDFVFVEDAVAPVVMACLSDAAPSVAMNIGTGVETTINDLARTVIQQSGSVSEIRHEPSRRGDVYRSVADIGRAATLLGFRPGVSFKDALARTLEWMEAFRRVGSAGGNSRPQARWHPPDVRPQK